MAIHSRFPEPTAIAKSFRKFRENFWNFREFFELFPFFNFFSLFSKNPGRRDLSAVKVSALYDAWRLKKRRKFRRRKKKVSKNFGSKNQFLAQQSRSMVNGRIYGRNRRILTDGIERTEISLRMKRRVNGRIYGRNRRILTDVIYGRLDEKTG